MFLLTLTTVFLVLLAGSTLLLGFRMRKRWLRVIGYSISGLLGVIAFGIVVVQLTYRDTPQVDLHTARWGVTFSGPQAEYLGSSWRVSYAAVLDELQPDVVRIPVYWNQIESVRGTFFFDDIDWQNVTLRLSWQLAKKPRAGLNATSLNGLQPKVPRNAATARSA
jgi:hypothetical protein